MCFIIKKITSKQLFQRRQWHPTPVLLPRKSHGQRSLEAAVHGIAKGRTRLSDFTSLFIFTFMHWRRKRHPTPVFLPGESQGWGSLVGCRLWGHTVWHDWSSDSAAAAAAYIYINMLSRFTLQPYGPYSPPGSSVYGMLQARILEWVAMPSSKGSSWPREGPELVSHTSPALAGQFFTTSTTREALINV